MLDALTKGRNTLSPNVHRDLKLHYAALVAIGLCLLEHVATAFVAFHDQLVKEEVVKVHVINILWQLSIPLRRRLIGDAL